MLRCHKHVNPSKLRLPCLRESMRGCPGRLMKKCCATDLFGFEGSSHSLPQKKQQLDPNCDAGKEPFGCTGTSKALHDWQRFKPENRLPQTLMVFKTCSILQWKWPHGCEHVSDGSSVNIMTHPNEIWWYPHFVANEHQKSGSKPRWFNWFILSTLNRCKVSGHAPKISPKSSKSYVRWFWYWNILHGRYRWIMLNHLSPWSLIQFNSAENYVKLCKTVFVSSECLRVAKNHKNSFAKQKK